MGGKTSRQSANVARRVAAGRAIDIREGDKVNGAALKGLIRAAAALNLESRGSSAAAKPALFAGGGKTGLGKA